MSTDLGRERRRHPRKNAGLNRIIPARVELGEDVAEEVQLFLVDVSEGGMRINVDRELPVEEGIRVSFSLNGQLDNQNLNLPCRVVWKRDLVGGTWVHGMRFSEQDPGDHHRLHSMVGELQGRQARVHFRLHRLLPMAFKVDPETEWVDCYAGDLSAEGLGLSLEQPLPPDQDIQVRLFPEFGLPPVHATARVAWCRHNGDRHRLGLKFVAIDEISSQVIRRYIDRCLEAGTA